MHSININLDTKEVVFSSTFMAGEHLSINDLLLKAINILERRRYLENNPAYYAAYYGRTPAELELLTPKELIELEEPIDLREPPEPIYE